MWEFNVLEELNVVTPAKSPLHVGAGGAAMLAGSASSQEAILEETCGGTG